MSIMLIRRVTLALLVVSSLLLLAACRDEAEPTATPQPTATAVPTATPQPTPTATPQPTPTPEPDIVEQLKQNVAGLDVQLAAEHVQALDRLSAPVLPFPSGMMQRASTFLHAGATVNGEPSSVWPLSPASDDERY